MASVNKQPIRLGNVGIGEVSIFGGGVRGQGRSSHPHLVLPLTVDLNNRPAESSLAITSIKGILGVSQHPSINDALCQPVVEHLSNQYVIHTVVQGSGERTVDLRFPLNLADVERLERLRHASENRHLVLYVAVEATVVGLKTYNQMGETTEELPWEFNLGMLSQMLPFWSCTINPVQVEIEQSTWVDNVLPGLGYDRLRLLELNFPAPLPDHSNAAKQFDRARLALDQRRYGDCIQECRGLLNMWEKQYGATPKAKPLATIVASDRGWPQDDIRRQLLDTLWKEVGDVANAPHHPEGDVDSELFDVRDARLVLLLTTALSEYVQRR
jgi:hypothetical protein